MNVPPHVQTPWAHFVTALVFASIGAGIAAVPSVSAIDVPVAPPLCAATFGSSGGQNAAHILATNSALARADGGAAQENSSHAEVGLGLTLAMSLTATVRMGVTYAGILRGALGINTNYGEVRITARLHDATAGVEIGSQVLLDKKQDGAAFQTIIDVVASNPFDPPLASFPDVDLIANHHYTMTLEVETAAKGLQGRADFKDDGFVRFGCVAVVAPLVDSDGDGLYDLWEENGIDVDFDGVIDVDLPAFGARSDHPSRAPMPPSKRPPRTTAPGKRVPELVSAPNRHIMSSLKVAGLVQAEIPHGSDCGTHSCTCSMTLPTISHAPQSDSQSLRDPVSAAENMALVSLMLQSVVPLLVPGSGVPKAASCHSALVGSRLREFPQAASAWNQVIWRAGSTPAMLTAYTLSLQPLPFPRQGE